MRTVLIVSLLMMSPLAANAALMYSSEEIRGTVVDGETDQPVEGVVVIAEWTVKKMMPAFGDAPGNRRTLVKLVAVTEKDGKYVIPAWGPKTVSPLEFMEGDSVHITILKKDYWVKHLSDIEPDTLAKNYDLSKVDDRQLVYRGFRTAFEEKVSKVANQAQSVPSHRRSVWNGKTIRLKRLIVGEEIKYIEMDEYPRPTKISKTTNKDEREQIARTKNACRTILQDESSSPTESPEKYSRSLIVEKCREILKEDVK